MNESHDITTPERIHVPEISPEQFGLPPDTIYSSNEIDEWLLRAQVDEPPDSIKTIISAK